MPEHTLTEEQYRIYSDTLEELVTANRRERKVKKTFGVFFADGTRFRYGLKNSWGTVYNAKYAFARALSEKSGPNFSRERVSIDGEHNYYSYRNRYHALLAVDRMIQEQVIRIAQVSGPGID